MFSPRRRALLACCGLACCFTGFSARLLNLQVARHDEFLKRAQGNYDGSQSIFAQRGNILDARGMALALNEPVKIVVADGTLVRDPDSLAQLIAEPMGMTVDAVKEKLMRTHLSAREKREVPLSYIVVRRNLPEEAATALSAKLEAAAATAKTLAEKENLRAISFKQDYVRIYPNNELLCHVVGTVTRLNQEPEGLEGIEKSMENYLHGHDGIRYTERDRKGRELVAFRKEEVAARDGRNVQLTVDAGLQMIVESEIESAYLKYKPTMAVGIMIRPQTGEVLAMANCPRFNLNQRTGVPRENRINQAIETKVEPGSTFKIVPVAAALSRHLVSLDTSIYCENRFFTFHGNTLHDHKAYGNLTVSEILSKSSNIGVAKLGIQLGEQNLYDYIRRFGYGEPTGIALPGEITGEVHPPHRWSAISITHVPMGQEVGATALQVISAMCVIANGGHLMMPQIVHEVTEQDGKVVATFPPVEVRRPITEKIAADVRTALCEVVSKNGTAVQARVEGFKVAGKTGTAQVSGGHGRAYGHNSFVVSFVGFLPAENPEFVCLVMMDRPTTVPAELSVGGLVAAPVFSSIATRAAEYLNLTPDPAEMSTKLAATPSARH